MKKIILLSLFFAIAFQNLNAQKITVGERAIINSEILNSERPVLIYLPPSYHFSPEEKFPVLYILDGDYNFHYVTGLIELWSNISENIPEMIVVGISGKGTPTYRKNCKPNIEGVKDSGNADEKLAFIEKELIPYMASNYKVADYNMLAGHSAGGIFVVNAALKRPNLFNEYIAISPALWWGENAMEKMAKEVLEKTPQFSSNIYMSLADEKGMGVREFVHHTKPLLKDTTNLRYMEFPEENHNSVGVKTYEWALTDIFKAWKTDSLYFTRGKEFEDLFQRRMDRYNNTFNTPDGLIGYTFYMIKDDPKKIAEVQMAIQKYFPNALETFQLQLASLYVEQKKFEEATAIVRAGLEKNPDAFRTYRLAAQISVKEEHPTLAREMIAESLKRAKRLGVRQWLLNEIMEEMESMQ